MVETNTKYDGEANARAPRRGRANLFFAAGAAAGAAFYFLVPCLALPLLFGPDAWISRVMADWIDLLTFMAFGSATMLLLERWWLLRGEARGFWLVASPGGADTLILPEDALEQRKRLRQLSPSDSGLIVVRLFNAALQRARANWSAQDAGEAVKTQAELLQGEQDAQYSMIRYMAWAIPSLGFIGTVLGIGEAMATLNVDQPTSAPVAATAPVDGAAVPSPPAADAQGNPPAAAPHDSPLKAAIGHLGTAFNTTFVALILSLILMFLVHRIQADEDAFLIRATDRCMREFVFRMHIPRQTAP
jgi:hypothetical protein